VRAVIIGSLGLYIINYKEVTLTTIPNSPLLQFIDQTNTVMLANFTGTTKSVAILDDTILDQLYTQCRNAKAEAQKTGNCVDATLELCTTLESVLKSYRKMRDEYHHRIEIELERDEAEQRLQDVQNEIQKSTPSR
jgi:hypothetical protein